MPHPQDTDRPECGQIGDVALPFGDQVRDEQHRGRSGSTSSRTRSVIAIEKTPSLNASTRLLSDSRRGPVVAHIRAMVTQRRRLWIMSEGVGAGACGRLGSALCSVGAVAAFRRDRLLAPGVLGQGRLGLAVSEERERETEGVPRPARKSGTNRKSRPWTSWDTEREETRRAPRGSPRIPAGADQGEQDRRHVLHGAIVPRA